MDEETLTQKFTRADEAMKPFSELLQVAILQVAEIFHAAVRLEGASKAEQVDFYLDCSAVAMTILTEFTAKVITGTLGAIDPEMRGKLYKEMVKSFADQVSAQIAEFIESMDALENKSRKKE